MIAVNASSDHLIYSNEGSLLIHEEEYIWLYKKAKECTTKTKIHSETSLWWDLFKHLFFPIVTKATK